MLERHPLSAICGDADPKSFQELVVDIQAKGLIDTITTLDGMILDGWHRYKACLETGEQTFFEEYQGVDPAGYVYSKNIPRRHSSAAVRAQVVVALRSWRPAWRPPGKSASPAELPSSPLDSRVSEEPPLSLHSEEPLTAQQLADEAGVSVRAIERAKTIERAGLGDAVRSGEISAWEVEQQAKPEKAPTKEEKLQVVIEGLNKYVEQLKWALDEATDSLQSHADLEGDEKEQFTLLEQLRTENRVLKSQVNQYMMISTQFKRECKALRKRLGE